MRTGDKVKWHGQEVVILMEYDEEFIYIATGEESAQLVHVDDLEES